MSSRHSSSFVMLSIPPCYWPGGLGLRLHNSQYCEPQALPITFSMCPSNLVLTATSIVSPGRADVNPISHRIGRELGPSAIGRIDRLQYQQFKQ